MHGELRQLRFGLKRLAPLEARHPRAAQRAAAADLEGALGEGWSLSSRSHCRGIVAVARGNPPLTRLGVDVELADPARPWPEIAALYMPAAETARLDVDGFCRLWTFGEAHFKAFGRVPSAELLARCGRAEMGDEPVAISGRGWWWAEKVDGFWLSLVWEEAV